MTAPSCSFLFVYTVQSQEILRSLCWCFFVCAAALLPFVSVSMELAALIAGASLASFSYSKAPEVLIVCVCAPFLEIGNVETVLACFREEIDVLLYSTFVASCSLAGAGSPDQIHSRLDGLYGSTGYQTKIHVGWT